MNLLLVKKANKSIFMALDKALQLIQTLTELGLSAKEANIYLTLLTIGANPASIIAKKAELNRSNCYTILNGLIQKGFVYQTNKDHITYFIAADPDCILRQLLNKKNDIDDKINNITEAITELTTSQKDYPNKPKVVFFDGASGIQNMLEDTLTSKDSIRSYSSLKELTIMLPDFFKTYYQQCINKKITTKAIYPSNELTCTHKRNANKNYRDIILIPPEFDFHIDLSIYNNKVAITSLREKFGLLIISKEIADAQKHIFDLIWEGSKKIAIINMQHQTKKPPAHCRGLFKST